MSIQRIKSGVIADGAVLNSVSDGVFFRNRIINGDMRIDQRNAGASGTASNAYTVDRWAYFGTQASKGTWQQNAGSVTPPAGFTNYLGFTSSSAYSVLSADLFEFYQFVEGLNIADLGWGTASAKTITVSFWVRSSLTGTFGAGLTNNGNTRNYPFTYTINAANTWEQKFVTIAGDTSGTWLTTNGIGLGLLFGLGAGASYSGTANAWNGTTAALFPTGATSVVGTNGATFYITGVQFEAGSVATPFERRPYGTELALCQRYYWRIAGDNSDYPPVGSGVCATSTFARVYVKYPVTMRTYPTISYSGTVFVYDGNAQTITTISGAYEGLDTTMLDFTVASGLTAGRGCVVYPNNASTNYFQASAEL
jgi:hypothetical protein